MVQVSSALLVLSLELCGQVEVEMLGLKIDLDLSWWSRQAGVQYLIEESPLSSHIPALCHLGPWLRLLC